MRDLEMQLVRHAGGPDATLISIPITVRLLIERLVRTTLQLNALDDKLAAGAGWTEHDCRTHGGLINRQRLLLRDLGMKPAAARPPTLQEHLARRAAERGETA
jgi:hypothetical protein